MQNSEKVGQRWPGREVPDNAKRTEVGYKMLSSQLEYTSLAGYKGAIVDLVNSEKFRVSPAGFHHRIEKGAMQEDFSFEDFSNTVEWDKQEPKYIQAISQFLVMCINQFLMDTKPPAVATAEAAHNDLQDALDIAKDQINVQMFIPGTQTLSNEIKAENFEAVTKVLKAALLTKKHSLNVNIDSAAQKVTYTLDYKKVIIDISYVLCVGDALVFNANIAAAILQAIAEPTADYALFKNLPNTLKVYGMMRGLYANIIEANGGYTGISTPEEIKLCTLKLMKAIYEVTTVVVKNTFTPDMDLLHAPVTVGDGDNAKRLNERCITHHILLFLMQSWQTAERVKGWSPNSVSTEVILGSKLSQRRKVLHLLLLQEAYRLMIPLENLAVFKDLALVRALTTFLTGKFGASVFPKDMIETVIQTAMYLFCITKAADVLLYMVVSPQGTSMDTSHKMMLDYTAGNKDDVNRVIYSMSPGVRRVGVKAHLFQEDVCATKVEPTN